MAALARGADPADIDAWWDRVLEAAVRIVLLGAGATATLALRYLRQHAGIERARVDPVRAVPARGLVETSLRVMGPVAFKTHMRVSGSETASLRVMTDQLSGTASSRVLDGDRDTVMATFAQQERMVGWRRKTRANACAFCLMLASRGAVYSRETVSFEAHKPRCHCTPEPLWRTEPEPPEVLALRDAWLSTTSEDRAKDKVRAWRRHIDAQRRTAVPPPASEGLPAGG